jgi:hypothetical protein
MKKLLCFMCFALLFAIIAPACFAQDNEDHVPFWWWGKNFTGTIAALSDTSITIVNNEKQEKTFEITPRTKIILRDSKALEKGMLVKITYQEVTKEKRTAKAIRELKMNK